jgi:hypothetical protein
VTALRRRSSRLAWTWCLAYTAPVRPEIRQRRRDEIFSHLWESESSGVRAVRVLSATCRGMADDLSWSCRRGWREAALLPEPWVAVAAMLPVGAAVVSAVAAAPLAHAAEGVGVIGGGTLLGVSALLWLRRRRG